VSTSILLITLAGSNVGCLVLGFMLGWMFDHVTRAAMRIEESMADDPSTRTEPPAPEPAPAPRERHTAVRIISVLLALVGVGTAVLGVVVTHQTSEAEARDDRLTACVTGYSNALADAFNARAAANSEASEAVDAVMAAIDMAFTDAPPVGRDRVQKAIKDYREARDKAKRTQAQHPLPDAPRDACADLIK